MEYWRGVWRANCHVSVGVRAAMHAPSAATPANARPAQWMSRRPATVAAPPSLPSAPTWNRCEQDLQMPFPR